MSDWGTESHRSSIQFAIEGIRALILSNGGAVVAILSFVGNGSQNTRADIIFPTIILSLKQFSIGLSCAVGCCLLSYMAQSFFTFQKNRIGIVFQISAIVCGLGSLFMFVLGSWLASEAFRAR